MRAETVIIGGGIVGLSIAYHLATMGHNDTIVLEQHYLGSGGTFRCATGIRASFTTEEHIVLLRKSIDLWKELSEKLGFYYLRGGYVWLLRTEEQLKAFSEFSKIHNKYGVPTKIVEPEEIRELVPTINTEGIIAGLYDPLAGKANPFEAMVSLAEASKEMGVKIYIQTRAEKIIVEKGKVKGVKSTVGDIQAKNVVIAAGYGSREIAKTAGLNLPLKNLPRHALVTEKFREVFKPLVIDWTTSSYIVQTNAGTFIIGADVEEEPDKKALPRIDYIPTAARIMVKIFPWLKYVNVLRYWTGYYVMSPDKHPILGPVKGFEGLYLATGFSGHGFMMAPIVGKVLAEWIIYGKPSIPQAERLTLERIEKGELILEKAVFG
ncbi:MAG: NAD(P)/FAD-dependent oxidoreductase [Candidatus Njordarchaeales archaeon]